MPRIRGEETGAKKRYAGLQLVDGKEEISFTGLESVRRDWTELSKRFQLGLLDRVFHKKEVANFIKDFVADLKKGKYDSLLIYKKAIRKELEGYTKTTPPHVKAARKLDKLTSSIIAYVMTEDGPEPVQKLEHKIDYEHYIDKQIGPIADSVLVFYGKTFKDVLENSAQTSLFGFSK
jgi:DNA polymerase-2